VVVGRGRESPLDRAQVERSLGLRFCIGLPDRVYAEPRILVSARIEMCGGTVAGGVLGHDWWSCG
jgi:hypothetical protein